MDKGIKLKDLRRLAPHDVIKVIGAGTGKVLIHNYKASKHEHLGELEITGIFTEISVGGTYHRKDWAKPILVGWALEDEYKELKEALYE